jgi:hypothetical protein
MYNNSKEFTEKIFRAVYVLANLEIFHDLFLPTITLFTVLKMCRNKLTRKFIVPKSSIFDPRGVYVLKTADQKDELFSENKNGQIRCHSKDYEKRASGRSLGTAFPLYLWKGMKIATNGI